MINEAIVDDVVNSKLVCAIIHSFALRDYRPIPYQGKGYSVLDIIEEIIKVIDSRNFVSIEKSDVNTAMIWDETPQGSGFWSAVYHALW